jgi:hypothetical protein
MPHATDNAAIHHVTQRLSRLFPSVQATVVAGAVRDSYRLFTGHPHPKFVPILVEEMAQDRICMHVETQPRTTKR